MTVFTKIALLLQLCTQVHCSLVYMRLVHRELAQHPYEEPDGLFLLDLFGYGN